MERRYKEILLDASGVALGMTALVGALGTVFGLGIAVQSRRDLTRAEQGGHAQMAADIRHDQDVYAFAAGACGIGGAASGLGLVVLNYARRRPEGSEGEIPQEPSPRM